MSHWMYVIKHLFHGYLCYITFITRKNDVIISLSNFTDVARGSKQKFDNDYDVIFMCYKCNIT